MLTRELIPEGSRNGIYPELELDMPDDPCWGYSVIIGTPTYHTIECTHGEGTS